MGTRYRPYEPDQPFLLPPSLREWLPEHHLAYFISDTIDQLDLSPLHQPYQGDGRRNQPYHPTMLVKVLIYAYASGVFSSRKIAKRLVEDVALRVLAAGNRPDFRTINRFRQQHLETFGQLFVAVVRLAKKMGLLKLGTVALDGTKIKANASRHKAMSYQRMREEEQRLQQEIAQLLQQAEQVDAAEDALYGEDNSGDEVPEELKRREDRLQKIREAKQALEEEQAAQDREQGRQPGDGQFTSGTRPQGGRSKCKRKFGEPPPKTQRNFSDPESRIMKSQQGFEQCYNAQAVVEAGQQLIVAQQVGQNAADNRSLIEMVDQVKNNTGRKPQRVLADAGYKGEDNLQALEERKIRGFVAQRRESKTERGGPPQGSGPATQRMVKRLKDRRGKRQYARRKGLVEPAFGWAKQVLGFRQFSLRGLKKVQGEWSLVTLALNLRRMAAMKPLAAADGGNETACCRGRRGTSGRTSSRSESISATRNRCGAWEAITAPQPGIPPDSSRSRVRCYSRSPLAGSRTSFCGTDS